MAISHKGMRKIVVGGETYHYKISSYGDIFHNSFLKVVIEFPDKIKTYNIERESRYTQFTPADVEKLIKGRIA